MIMNPPLDAVSMQYCADSSTHIISFETERGCQEFCDPPRVRTSAYSRAELESPRTWILYSAGAELSATTMLRAAALKSKSTRSLGRTATVDHMSDRHPVRLERSPQPMQRSAPRGSIAAKCDDYSQERLSTAVKPQGRN